MIGRLESNAECVDSPLERVYFGIKPVNGNLGGRIVGRKEQDYCDAPLGVL